MAHLTDAQLQTLKAEIETDPTARGYAEPYAAGNDGETTVLLNQRSAAAGSVESEPVGRDAVLEAITAANFDGLTSANADKLDILIAGATVNIARQSIFDKFATIFPNGGNTIATHTALTLLRTRPASRAEVLFGRGSVVDADDVSRSRFV